jgi:hypothetical protein
MIANSAPGVFTQDGRGQGNAVVFDLDKLFGNVLMPGDTWRRFYVYATGVRGATIVQVMIDGLPVTVEAVRPVGDCQVSIKSPSFFPQHTGTGALNTGQPNGRSR